MSALAIAARELRERSRLFLICAALAVLPFIAGVLPGARADRAGVITTTSSYLALALALGTALVFGASTVVRDLVERRLSFYFSKPISASAIWFGKAAAALLSSLACFAIIAVPAALLVPDWPGPGMWMVEGRDLIALTVAGVIVLFFLGHLVSTMVRSRSILIAIDFGCAAALAIVLLLLARPLLTGAAIQLTATLASIVAVAVLVVAMIAPVLQLERGRTDIRRSHAALSRWFWPPLFAVVLGITAYVLWVIAPDPAALSRVLYIEQPPAAERIFAAGTTAGRGDYHAAFAIERDGTWRRVGISPWSDVQFSRDGRVLAWFEPAGLVPSSEQELHTTSGPTGIISRGYVATALSDDGSRVAVGRGNLVSVYETASGRLLASAGGFEASLRHTMFFVSNDVLRVLELSYANQPAPLRVFELDVPRKKLTRTGEIRAVVGGPLIASHDGSRLLLRRMGRVVDGRTLATLAEVPPREGAPGAILSDGRVVEIVREGKVSRLRVVGGGEVTLPAHVTVVGELADGKVIVRATKVIGWSATGTDRTMFVIDPDRGTIVNTTPHIRSVGPDWDDPRLKRYEAARLAAIDREGKIVWWDPRTGRVEPAPAN